MFTFFLYWATWGQVDSLACALFQLLVNQTFATPRTQHSIEVDFVKLCHFESVKVSTLSPIGLSPLSLSSLPLSYITTTHVSVPSDGFIFL